MLLTYHLIEFVVIPVDWPCLSWLVVRHGVVVWNTQTILEKTPFVWEICLRLLHSDAVMLAAAADNSYGSCQHNFTRDWRMPWRSTQETRRRRSHLECGRGPADWLENNQSYNLKVPLVYLSIHKFVYYHWRFFLLLCSIIKMFILALANVDFSVLPKPNVGDWF